MQSIELCEQIILEDSQQLADVLLQHQLFVIFIGLFIGFFLGKFLGERNYFRVQPEIITGFDFDSYEPK